MEEEIKALLKKCKMKAYTYEQRESRIILGIRDTRSGKPQFVKKMQENGFTLISAVYGRWEFRINNYRDLS